MITISWTRKKKGLRLTFTVAKYFMRIVMLKKKKKGKESADWTIKVLGVWPISLKNHKRLVSEVPRGLFLKVTDQIRSRRFRYFPRTNYWKHVADEPINWKEHLHVISYNELLLIWNILPCMMLEKGRVTWPMKSRPMGSSSHTTNRNTARSGNVRMKVIVSSQTGLNPGK